MRSASSLALLRAASASASSCALVCAPAAFIFSAAALAFSETVSNCWVKSLSAIANSSLSTHSGATPSVDCHLAAATRRCHGDQSYAGVRVTPNNDLRWTAEVLLNARIRCAHAEGWASPYSTTLSTAVVSAPEGIVKPSARASPGSGSHRKYDPGCPT